jgi:serine/threonine protein kinase HipA of HipAB toxin-antitoxin module
MSCRIGEVVLRLRLLRIPLEDRCRALSIPPALKYERYGGPGMESILRLLRGSDSLQEDQRTFSKPLSSSGCGLGFSL